MKGHKKKNKAGKTVDFSRFSDLNRGGHEFQQRERHKATCADCGKECEVPFVPTEGRPVYCRECFAKRKSQGS